MTWAKICGNTSLEDAQLALDLGADALGFIFAESKRRITPAQAAAITSNLPKQVERVGVVYSRDADEIVAIVQEAGLTAVQLHGGMDLVLVDHLRERLGAKVSLIQTLHWVVGTDSSEKLRSELNEIATAGTVKRVLIDSRVGAAGGGTGVSFDWEAARSLFVEAAAKDLHIIVAGGLRPDNVAEAIHQLKPWGVDVSSGVEASPGRKDPEKVAAFLRIAKTAP
jgi:phosphoribosylanthranilate isomerase